MKRLSILFVVLFFVSVMSVMSVMADTYQWAISSCDLSNSDSGSCDLNPGVNPGAIFGSGTLTTVYSGTPNVWNITSFDGNYVNNSYGISGTTTIDNRVGFTGTSTDGLFTYDNQLDNNLQLVNGTAGLLFDVNGLSGTEINLEYGGTGPTPFADQLYETFPGNCGPQPCFALVEGIYFVVTPQNDQTTPEPFSMILTGTGLFLVVIGKKRFARK
jgi:hypothetical protein